MIVRFGDREPVADQTDVVGERVVLDAGRDGRRQTVGERRAPLRAVDVDPGDPARAEGPPRFILMFRGPTDRAAFAGSHGSRRDFGRRRLDVLECDQREDDGGEDHGASILTGS